MKLILACKQMVYRVQYLQWRYCINLNKMGISLQSYTICWLKRSWQTRQKRSVFEITCLKYSKIFLTFESDFLFLQITPTQYEKEMRMNTMERLQNLNSIQIDNIVSSGKKPDKVVLSFTPKILVFQNFKPNDRVVAKFSVKNISKVRRRNLYN